MKRVIDEKTLKALYPPMETAFETQMRQTLRSLPVERNIEVRGASPPRFWLRRRCSRCWRQRRWPLRHSADFLQKRRRCR